MHLTFTSTPCPEFFDESTFDGKSSLDEEGNLSSIFWRIFLSLNLSAAVANLLVYQLS